MTKLQILRDLVYNPGKLVSRVAKCFDSTPEKMAYSVRGSDMYPVVLSKKDIPKGVTERGKDHITINEFLTEFPALKEAISIYADGTDFSFIGINYESYTRGYEVAFDQWGNVLLSPLAFFPEFNKGLSDKNLTLRFQAMVMHEVVHLIDQKMRRSLDKDKRNSRRATSTSGAYEDLPSEKRTTSGEIFFLMTQGLSEEQAVSLMKVKSYDKDLLKDLLSRR